MAKLKESGFDTGGGKRVRGNVRSLSDSQVLNVYTTRSRCEIFGGVTTTEQPDNVSKSNAGRSVASGRTATNDRSIQRHCSLCRHAAFV